MLPKRAVFTDYQKIHKLEDMKLEVKTQKSECIEIPNLSYLEFRIIVDLTDLL